MSVFRRISVLVFIGFKTICRNISNGYKILSNFFPGNMIVIKCPKNHKNNDYLQTKLPYNKCILVRNIYEEYLDISKKLFSETENIYKEMQNQN